MSWPVIVSTAAFVFCLVSFIYFRSYLKKRTSREELLSDIREEINRILLRVDEITDRDISLIEDKEKSLKALLEETEKRIKVYTRELDRSLVNEKAYRELGKSKALFSEHPSSGEAPLRDPSPLPQPVPESPEEKPPAASSGETPEPKAPSIGEQIRKLANGGFTSPVIASKLGISITEVELAIALLERKSF